MIDRLLSLSVVLLASCRLLLSRHSHTSPPLTSRMRPGTPLPLRLCDYITVAMYDFDCMHSNWSGKVLNAVAEVMPELVGGSADLAPSNKTELKCSGDFQAATPEGRYLRFGVREHGMAAVCNGIAAYGGLLPYCATFLNFIS